MKISMGYEMESMSPSLRGLGGGKEANSSHFFLYLRELSTT